MSKVDFKNKKDFSSDFGRTAKNPLEILINPTSIENTQEVVHEPVKTVNNVVEGAPIKQATTESSTVVKKKAGKKKTTEEWSKKNVVLSIRHQNLLAEVIEMENVNYNFYYNERAALEEAIDLVHKQKRQKGLKLKSEM